MIYLQLTGGLGGGLGGLGLGAGAPISLGGGDLFGASPIGGNIFGLKQGFYATPPEVSYQSLTSVAIVYLLPGVYQQLEMSFFSF